ncbi:hypothetical protein [Phenylobacterium sp.]|jgi:hypothetical protein|uniref:hypothetical protein n=1 Tax=Phenylobacterium sp. TaxID=1871053 RepID=UPI002F9469CB
MSRSLPPAPALLRLRLAPEPGALTRVLGVVQTSQAHLRSVSHVDVGACAWSLLEVEGLEPARAELLARRLADLPCVEALSRVATA